MPWQACGCVPGIFPGRAQEFISFCLRQFYSMYVSSTVNIPIRSRSGSTSRAAFLLVPSGRIVQLQSGAGLMSSSWSIRRCRRSPLPCMQRRGRPRATVESPYGGHGLKLNAAARYKHLSPPRSSATGGIRSTFPPAPWHISGRRLIWGEHWWRCFPSLYGMGGVQKRSDHERCWSRPSQSSRGRWPAAARGLVGRFYSPL